MSVRVPNARCVRSTSTEMLVEIGGREIWLQQSQITGDSEVWYDGDEGALVVTDRVALLEDLL